MGYLKSWSVWFFFFFLIFYHWEPMGREKPMGRVSKVSCMSFGWRLCPFEGSQIPLLLLDGRDVPCRGTALQDQCCYQRNRSKSEHLQGSFTIETKGEEKETNTIQQYFAQDFIWTAFIIISKHSSLPLLHKWLNRQEKGRAHFVLLGEKSERSSATWWSCSFPETIHSKNSLIS